MPHNQTPWQPTPGPSATQFLEDFFWGPSQAPELHEEPDPELALTQSTEEPFACPATPSCVIIINNTPVGSPPPLVPSPGIPPITPESTTTSSPQSYNEAWKEFTYLRPTLMNLQAFGHDSINQILFEHQCFLHMIPFVDASHENEMHREFQEELNSLLGQAPEAYPKENIIGIV
ncbi:hypothetical protein O181_073911 [Austropuccinia psidii MF-1]|uniref:Uncharacterized protein n=1 Tax=Austropuccinia psidii MF-1 TaxID=1389203 RepID=A0A9Q3F5J9_9BASI|nr:hypothetical protein [Austropuccinia psidii MF-1]